MARGANFKIGRSSDRHNFRDFDDKFIQPQTHLAITNPDHQCKDMITILGKRAGDLSAENCRGFQKKIQRQLKNEYINSCKKDGRKRAGNAKLVLEAVINLEEHHTKEDLKKLRDRLEKDLNIEMLYLVAHFDEGHQDKNGEIKINAHAHFKFTTLVDGKVTERNKAWVRKAQDICAEVLEMKRGEAVEISGKKGMGHKAYRQSKRNEENQAQELEEIKQEICNVAGVSDFQRARKIMKESGLAKAADYSELKKWRSLGKSPEEVLQFAESFKQKNEELENAIDDEMDHSLKLSEQLQFYNDLEQVAENPDKPKVLAEKFIKKNELLETDMDGYELGSSGEQKANKYFNRFSKFLDINHFYQEYIQKVGMSFFKMLNAEKKRSQGSEQEPLRGDNGIESHTTTKKRR